MSLKDGDTAAESTLIAPQSAVLDPKPESITKTGTQTKETPTDANESGQEDVDPPPKKSLAFKLAFVGLASSCFVFQLDATALGIALPVRTHLSSKPEIQD